MLDPASNARLPMAMPDPSCRIPAHLKVGGIPAPLPNLAHLVWMLIRLAAGSTPNELPREDLPSDRHSSASARHAFSPAQMDARGTRWVRLVLSSIPVSLPQLVLSLIYLSRVCRRQALRTGSKPCRKKLPIQFIRCLRLAGNVLLTHKYANSSNGDITNGQFCTFRDPILGLLNLSVSDAAFSQACKKIKWFGSFLRRARKLPPLTLAQRRLGPALLSRKTSF
ncbi:hypothetical protein DFS34DRAFT_619569 [Phlyctochytrium arcticum]|nr:hypothetical protein DFS34DRAFT_619569 [Phlyctochytrium arcticum]